MLYASLHYDKAIPGEPLTADIRIEKYSESYLGNT